MNNIFYTIRNFFYASDPAPQSQPASSPTALLQPRTGDSSGILTRPRPDNEQRDGSPQMTPPQTVESSGETSISPSRGAAETRKSPSMQALWCMRKLSRRGDDFLVAAAAATRAHAAGKISEETWSSRIYKSVDRFVGAVEKGLILAESHKPRENMPVMTEKDKQSEMRKLARGWSETRPNELKMVAGWLSTPVGEALIERLKHAYPAEEWTSRVSPLDAIDAMRTGHSLSEAPKAFLRAAESARSAPQATQVLQSRLKSVLARIDAALCADVEVTSRRLVGQFENAAQGTGHEAKRAELTALVNAWNADSRMKDFTPRMKSDDLFEINRIISPFNLTVNAVNMAANAMPASERNYLLAVKEASREADVAHSQRESLPTSASAVTGEPAGPDGRRPKPGAEPSRATRKLSAEKAVLEYAKKNNLLGRTVHLQTPKPAEFSNINMRVTARELLRDPGFADTLAFMSKKKYAEVKQAFDRAGVALPNTSAALPHHRGAKGGSADVRTAAQIATAAPFDLDEFLQHLDVVVTNLQAKQAQKALTKLFASFEDGALRDVLERCEKNQLLRLTELSRRKDGKLPDAVREELEKRLREGTALTADALKQKSPEGMRRVLTLIPAFNDFAKALTHESDTHRDLTVLAFDLTHKRVRKDVGELLNEWPLEELERSELDDLLGVADVLKNHEAKARIEDAIRMDVPSQLASLTAVLEDLEDGLAAKPEDAEEKQRIKAEISSRERACVAILGNLAESAARGKLEEIRNLFHREMSLGERITVQKSLDAGTLRGISNSFSLLSASGVGLLKSHTLASALPAVLKVFQGPGPLNSDHAQDLMRNSLQPLMVDTFGIAVPTRRLDELGRSYAQAHVDKQLAEAADQLWSHSIRKDLMRMNYFVGNERVTGVDEDARLERFEALGAEMVGPELVTEIGKTLTQTIGVASTSSLALVEYAPFPGGDPLIRINNESTSVQSVRLYTKGRQALATHTSLIQQKAGESDPGNLEMYNAQRSMQCAVTQVSYDKQGKPHVDFVAVGTAEVVADAARDKLFEKDPSSFVNRQKRINRTRHGSEQVEGTADSAFFTTAPGVKGTSSEVLDLTERAKPADQTERVDQTEQAVSSNPAEAAASTSEAGSTTASNSPAPSSPTQHSGSPTVSETIPFLAGLIEAGEPLNDYLRYSTDQRKSMLGAMQSHMAEIFRDGRGLEAESLQSTALLMFHPDVPEDDKKQATLLVAKHMNLFLEVGNARDVEDWKIVSPRNELSKEELSFAIAAQGIGLGGGDGVIPIYVFEDSLRERPTGESLAQRLHDFNKPEPEAIVLAFGNQYMPAVVQRDPNSGKVKLTVVNTESQRGVPPVHEQRARGIRELLSGDDTLEVQIVQEDSEFPDASGTLSLMLLSAYCDPQQQGADFATFATRYMNEFRTATQDDRTDWIAAARARSFISSNEELKRTPDANVEEGT